VRRTRLRARSAGSEVPVDRLVTSLLTELVYQHDLDPAERDATLLCELVDELASLPQVAIVDLADMAAGLVEALAERLDEDPLELLRRLTELRGRPR